MQDRGWFRLHLCSAGITSFPHRYRTGRYEILYPCMVLLRQPRPSENLDMTIITQMSPIPSPTPPSRESALRAQATELEAFLFAELLRVSGTGRPDPAGGGGTQFDSFLRQSQAEAVASSGQTGLAEAIYRSLARTA